MARWHIEVLGCLKYFQGEPRVGEYDSRRRKAFEQLDSTPSSSSSTGVVAEIEAPNRSNMPQSANLSRTLLGQSLYSFYMLLFINHHAVTQSFRERPSCPSIPIKRLLGRNSFDPMKTRVGPGQLHPGAPIGLRGGRWAFLGRAFLLTA